MDTKTAEEDAASRDIVACLKRLTAQAHAANLANAVLLAQQAACEHGPLVEHFAELGRRYSHLLEPKKATRATLRVVKGGSV